MTDLISLARAADLRALRAALMQFDTPGIVAELERLDRVTRAVAFRSLPKDTALAVFEDLAPALQRELLAGLRDETVTELIAGLNPDDRAGLFDELPAGIATRLLAELGEEERRMTMTLLGYPPYSAGRRMTPLVVSVAVEMTVGEAREHVRQHEPGAETIYVLPVEGEGRKVVGVVSLRRLFVNADDVPVADVMSEPVVVPAHTDQEEAAQLVRDHGHVGLPVVDAENRLVGLFTVDDAMRVLKFEVDEDAARAGGSEPLRRPYLTTTVLGLVRSRILWLLVLIAAAVLTVSVLDHFEQTLAEVVALALFVPLLIGTAGNTGSQAATTVVRAMAVGDVRWGELARVVRRESLTGLLLGTALALVAAVPASVVAGGQIALVLGLALVVVCTLATTAGACTPMVAKRMGLDPAVVSAPFITTFVDATGLVVYFLIARAVLGL